MSCAVLNSQFLTRLLISGEEDIERVSMLKADISSTACELTMLIFSIAVTFSVTCLTVTSLITNSCRQRSNKKGSSFLTYSVVTVVLTIILRATSSSGHVITVLKFNNRST